MPFSLSIPRIILSIIRNKRFYIKEFWRHKTDHVSLDTWVTKVCVKNNLDVSNDEERDDRNPTGTPGSLFSNASRWRMPLLMEPRFISQYVSHLSIRIRTSVQYEIDNIYNNNLSIITIKKQKLKRKTNKETSIFTRLLQLWLNLKEEEE